MCSLTDWDSVPDDLSGDHDDDNSDTFLMSEQDNSIETEQTICDAGPCKKQRVTTQSHEISLCESDLPLNKSNNSNTHCVDVWNNGVDSTDKNNSFGTSLTLMDGTSCDYLPLRVENHNEKILGNMFDERIEIENRLKNNICVNSGKTGSSLVVRNQTDRCFGNTLKKIPEFVNPSISNDSVNSDKCITTTREKEKNCNICHHMENDIWQSCVENDLEAKPETIIQQNYLEKEFGVKSQTNIRQNYLEKEFGVKSQTNFLHNYVEEKSVAKPETIIRHNYGGEKSVAKPETIIWHNCVEKEFGVDSQIRHNYVEEESSAKPETDTCHGCSKEKLNIEPETNTRLVEDLVLEEERRSRNCCLEVEQNCCLSSTDDASSSMCKSSVCLKKWSLDDKKSSFVPLKEANQSLKESDDDKMSSFVPVKDSIHNLKEREVDDKSSFVPVKDISRRSYDGDTRDLRGFRKLLDNNTNCDPGDDPSVSTSTQNLLSCKKINVFDVPATQVLNKPETFFDTSSTTFTDSNQTNFSKIPFGILVHILRYLSLCDRLHRVCYVCRQWHEATLDPSLWRRLTLFGQSKLNDSILNMVTSYSDRVLYLDLTDSREGCFTDAGFITVLNKCKYLKTFKMARYFVFSDQTFSHIGMCCPALRHLNLDVCFSCVNDKTIIAIGKGCPHLETLYLSQCNKVSDAGIVALAHGCPRLKQLRVDQCVKIGDVSLQELTVRCPDIDYLHLLSCSLTDNGIQHLSKLVNLRMLDISNIQQLSSRCVEIMVRSCKKLEVLSVSLNRAVDDECIRVIVQECKSLKRFSCVACNLTDKALEYMGMYSTSLEKIDVAWCGDISDHGVRFISESLISLEYLGLLRCSQVTMETIDELVDKFPHIHYSNFVLESRKLMRQAQNEGFKIPPIKDL